MWKWNKLQELVWVLWIVKVFVGATIVPSTALMATKGLKESSVM
ncbi:putative membrane protein [Bacteroides fragilis str. I1345]|uniref:Membrane protein n=1 Tax=Bacteroides fragilis str. 3783N1-6 TaxID=1339310 RepID=A0AB73ARE3_BACFG|nr:putative membrane protein [Bacteroides fragilis str. 3783N1-2]EXY52957.1 putative membrane protein [Bacteroides fragilis str. 3783N2-1]EXY57721.1 putative membrane protein [Bacteroides fragilis str. 3976T7]EXZ21263.1 putative membrane protein [Bacteroides fragilis str. J-143-4]EXZ70210.1 putative membrane protein [Bacteroides fragilis str. 3783N1-8]EYA31409.1 putative membrane protein [Bacteroides fragilis str. 1009-4-F \